MSKISEFWGIFFEILKKRSGHVRNKTQAATPPLERSWSSACTRRKSGPFAVFSLCKNGIPLTYFIPSNKVTQMNPAFGNRQGCHQNTRAQKTLIFGPKNEFFLQDLRLFDTLFTKSFEILQIPSTLSRRIFC